MCKIGLTITFSVRVDNHFKRQCLLHKCGPSRKSKVEGKGRVFRSLDQKYRTVRMQKGTSGHVKKSEVLFMVFDIILYTEVIFNME